MHLPVDKRREWIRSRREQRKLMRRARLRRQMLRYGLLSLLVLMGVSGFYYAPWCNVNRGQALVLKGNKTVTYEQVKQALIPCLSKPLYELDPRKLETTIGKIQMVKCAFVRRYCLPQPKLIVEVMEEFPWATYSTQIEGEPKWVIAESGRKITISDFSGLKLPKLKIYGAANHEFTDREVGQWATWIAYVEKQTQKSVAAIDLRNGQDVWMQAGDLCLRLGSADPSLTRRLGRLASVLSVIEPFKERLEYVNLGLDNNIPLKLARKAENQLHVEQGRDLNFRL